MARYSPVRTASPGFPARLRAFSVVEMMIAGTVLSLLVVGLVGLFVSGTALFSGTSANAYREMDVAKVARLLQSEVAPACDYLVSSDGRTLQYYPLKHDSASGLITSPPGKDTVRSFSVQGTAAPYSLIWIADGKTRTVLTGLPSAQVFTPLSGKPNRVGGSVGNIITATLVTQQSYSVARGSLRTAEQRALVRVTARNCPVLTNGR